MSGQNTTLVDRASRALERSPYIASRNMRIESEQGRLMLTGSVTSYYEKQMAQEALRRVDGVETIDNHLEVAWRTSEASLEAPEASEAR